MIILNYSDCPITLSLVDEVRGYECLDSVVVMDNHSSGDSWRHLQPFNGSEKVHVIRIKQNGGHGLGNQEGINYAVGCPEAEYIIIANPDIHVTQHCICRIKDALNRTRGVAATSARVRDPQGGELFPCWTLLPLWKGLLDTELVARRLFRAVLNTPSHKLAYAGDRDCRLVDAVPGSFLMSKTGVLTPGEIKGVFNKHIFLYYEKKVLGRKFRKMGPRTVLVTDGSYVHAHSVGIGKSFKRIVDRQRLLHRNKLYYYREYLGTSSADVAAARAVLEIVPAEVWLLIVVCRMRWQGGMRRQVLRRRAARRQALRYSTACRRGKVTYGRTGR